MQRRKNKLPKGGEYQLIIQYQMDRPENICITSIIQAYQVGCNFFVFRIIHVYTCVHVATMKKETLNLKHIKHGHVGEFGGRKEKREMI